MTQMKLAYLVAKTQKGVHEIAGPKHNQKIIEYGQSTTLQATDDEGAWCSNFVNWCYIIAGILLNPTQMNKLLKLAKYEDKDIVLFFNSAAELASKVGFQNWVSSNATGIAVKLPTRQGNARSWQNFSAESKDPQEGDIVILWRETPTSWKGHVAFLVKKGLTFVTLFGGNQANQVCAADYSRTRVLSYRKDLA